MAAWHRDRPLVHAALISKWRKPGYEILCSMSAIQRSGTNFGTTSICRVPLAQRAGQIMPSVTTGCVSCVSGDGIDGGPVWWTDPYTAWAAKKKADKNQKRKAEAPLDADTEARLKALRGEGPSGSSGGTDAQSGDGLRVCMPSNGGGAGDGGIALDPETEARLQALRGGGAQAAAPAKSQDYSSKGYDSD